MRKFRRFNLDCVELGGYGVVYERNVSTPDRGFRLFSRFGLQLEMLEFLNVSNIRLHYQAQFHHIEYRRQ